MRVPPRPLARHGQAWLIGLTLLIGLAFPTTPVVGQAIDYERQVDVAPTEESIGEGYQTPEVQRPLPRAAIWHTLDVVLLTLALGLAAWLAIWRFGCHGRNLKRRMAPICRKSSTGFSTS